MVRAGRFRSLRLVAATGTGPQRRDEDPQFQHHQHGAGPDQAEGHTAVTESGMNGLAAAIKAEKAEGQTDHSGDAEHLRQDEIPIHHHDGPRLPVRLRSLARLRLLARATCTNIQ